MLNLSNLDKQLLNDFQKDFPLTSAPYYKIAQRLGVDEHTVIERLKTLMENGLISRIGPVFRVNRLGASTLAAMSVPEQQIDEVAEFINGFTEVNHNYEREHEFNLWFVITARNDMELHKVIEAIEKQTGIEVLRLPLQETYHIDLGFELLWQT